MKPFQDHDLQQVIASRWDSVHQKIDEFSNEEIMANDLDVIADNIFCEFCFEPVLIEDEDASKRSIKQGKIRKPLHTPYREFYGQDFADVDGVIATFFFPYHGDTILFRCRASTFSLGVYPEIEIDKGFISFRIERSLSEMDNPNAKEALLDSLNHDVSEIREGISFANRDVSSFNNALKAQSRKMIEEKRKKVEAFFQIANMFEVPIEKQEYAKTHIPLKRKINPLATHYDSSHYYGISDTDYSDILSTIKHTVSTYERTPTSYKSLQEEDLRNTILAALNATYKGDATGETFRNSGKTDICIERENRAAFVAECKIWTGASEVSKAISQLDSYLTWRDCKTALIFFVRRKDFLKILDSAVSALRTVDGMKNCKEIDKNEFECLFFSRSNPGQQIKIRVMLFNLYCD